MFHYVGGGRVLTTEFEASKVERARENFTEVGLINLVEIGEGDALQRLAHDLPETLDVMLLDRAKALYAGVLALVESRLGRWCWRMMRGIARSL